MSANLFEPPYTGVTGPHPLAVMVEGQFPDTYAGREIPAWPAAAVPADSLDPLAAGPEPLPADPQPGQLLLIGSAKMFDDNIISAPQNALLLLNAVDYLVGSRDLLAIRSKILTRRVIRPVSANEKLVWRIAVVFLVPVLLAAYGIVRAGVRRRDAASYRQTVLRRTSTRKGV